MASSKEYLDFILEQLSELAAAEMTGMEEVESARRDQKKIRVL